jgi:nitrite reductase (NO-forming)
MIQHVARGMIGAIIVDPKDRKAMPKADREYVLVQSELFKDPDDVQAMFDRKYEHVVFNGGVFRYDPVHGKSGGNFLEAKPGERVRIYFVNAGPNNFSAVHPIAELWEGCMGERQSRQSSPRCANRYGASCGSGHNGYRVG